jgi:preflagellin peptidase FlaK
LFALPPHSFSLIYFLVAGIALAIASYTDLKQRIVSDKISYGLIVIGLLLHALQAFFANNAMIFGTALAVCILTFVFGYVLWKLGVWAGGDVKLFTGLAAVVPFNPNVIGALTGIGLLKTIALPLFPLTLFVFSVFSMLPFGLLLAARALKEKHNAEKKQKIFDSLKKRALELGEFAIATTGILEILFVFNQNSLWLVPLLIVLGLLPKLFRAVVIVLVAVFALLRQPIGFIESTIALFVLLFVVFVLLKLAKESKGLLNYKKTISELEEGDIPAETIVIENGKLLKVEGFGIEKVINYFKTNNLVALKSMLEKKGKIVCSQNRACGLTIEEIKELKALEKKGLLGKEFWLKKSTAFVPAILIAFIVLNVIGDLFWNLLLKI